jgi:hypothetical protein
MNLEITKVSSAHLVTTMTLPPFFLALMMMLFATSLAPALKKNFVYPLSSSFSLLFIALALLHMELLSHLDFSSPLF